MELDSELQKIKEWVEAPKVGLVNFAKQKELVESYVIIKDIILANDPDATIEIVEAALQTGAMSISVVTSDVTVYNTETFAAAIKNADNFQVYPRTDDKVKLDILFEGIIEYTLQD